jgi:4'-phosphopantetheinyl transferase
VWRADLACVPASTSASLTQEERDRAARILNPLKGRRWAVCRGLLRELLGAYLELEPASLRFQTTARGRPYLPPGGRRRRISFNLSHSGPTALFAFTRSGSVGIDVEVERRPLDELLAARRAFGAPEAERLEALAPVARRREFLSMWVRHEAEAQCLGDGLAQSPAYGQRLQDTSASERRATVHADRPLLWLLELDLGDGKAGAVVADPAPEQVRCWDWTG